MYAIGAVVRWRRQNGKAVSGISHTLRPANLPSLAGLSFIRKDGIND